MCAIAVACDDINDCPFALTTEKYLTVITVTDAQRLTTRKKPIHYIRLQSSCRSVIMRMCPFYSTPSTRLSSAHRLNYCEKSSSLLIIRTKVISCYVTSTTLCEEYTCRPHVCKAPVTPGLRPGYDLPVTEKLGIVGKIVERTYDWSQRSWVIARAKSVAARSYVMFKTSHTWITTRLRRSCDQNNF